MKWRWPAVCLLLAVCIGTVSASEITVFSQDFTTGGVPSNIGIGSEATGTIANNTINFNPAGYLELNMTYGQTGNAYLTGFTPAVKTRYNLTINSYYGSNWNSMDYIYGTGIYVGIKRVFNGNLLIYCYYKDVAGTLQSPSLLISSGTYTNPFTLTIDFDGVNKSYKTGIGSTSLEVPLYDVKGIPLPYDAVSGTDLKFSAYPYSGESNESLRLYTITQTVTSAGNVTAIGDKTQQSFGIDYENKGYWDAGESYVDSQNNGAFTFWADTRYNDADTVTFVKDYVTRGGELGIHFSYSNPTNATVDSEVATITSRYGTAPTSWCAEANVDNITTAYYAYQTHGLIWRNGILGISGYSNVGNLDNATWPWWYNTSQIGVAMRSFTHATDADPATSQFNIDYSKFQTWVQQATSHGKTITPFYKWYMTGANTHDASFSENAVLSGELLNFTANTNGYPAYVQVDISYDSDNYVYNITDGITEVSFSQSLDGNTAFYVDDDSTYLITDSPLIPIAAAPIPYHPAVPKKNTDILADVVNGIPQPWGFLAVGLFLIFLVKK